VLSAASSPHVAVLAHWDPLAEFAEAADLTLEGLRAAGFDVVVVSTSASHDRLVGQLEGRVLAVVTRENVGFDFLSWARGLDVLRSERIELDRLVLTNTSMYGPLWPLSRTLDRLWSLPADVFGLTASREFGPHVQSYFLAFGPRAMRSPRFTSYWKQVRPATNKWGTILAHEQRWARDLTVDGREPGVLVPAEGTSLARNPLTFTWRRVVLQGVPFVKRSLFVSNPDRVDMRGWREFLAENAPEFDCGVIDRDVRRLTGAEATR
jgi:lipopolysaccharide biosynthesis protein